MGEANVRRHEDGPSDAAVIARIRAGEQEAYRILVRRYQDRLYRYALRMTNSPDAAADMVQNGLVKAYTRLDRCRDPDRFGAWLFRIVANACRDHFRRNRRRGPTVDQQTIAPLVPGEDDDPARDLERAELRRVIDHALAELPEQQREAFVLKHVEDYSYEEMAEMLDASISALKMRVHRAREALQTLLKEALS